MTTPQRALELANWLRKEQPYFDTLGNRYFDLSGSVVDEIEAVVRHYAEIMQAEPVAEISYSRAKNLEWLADPDDFESGAELIIKPKPLP